MAASDLIIKGAREHNLRSVDLVLPRNKLICLTGVSGSGKSSLAFDTVYAEGQRRYIESLSSFARQFVGQMPKPDVDSIEGLSPSISISQKSSGQNPRSTVGTITEIYDYLRVLYARVGIGYCPNCDRPITAQTREQIIARIESLPAKTQFMILAPIVRQQKGEHRDLFEDLLKQGFVRARVDGQIVRLTDDLQLDRQMRHNIEVVVDRLTRDAAAHVRLAEAVELALKLAEGDLIVAIEEPDQASEANSAKAGKKRARAAAGLQPGDIRLSAHYACTHCNRSFAPPTPQMFSFNSPQGMCFECDGLGEVYTFDPERLATEPNKSFKLGCIELIGRWSELGRWKRHIYKGVAETMERRLELEAGTLSDTPWQDLPPKLRDIWLWGTGDTHITYTWRQGPKGQKYGGNFEGIIPELIAKYRNCKSKPLIRKLEKFMRQMECPDCHGQRLVPQSRAVRIKTAHRNFKKQSELSLPEVSQLSVTEASEFFSKLDLDDLRTRIAAEVLKEISGRLGFLVNVGLEYLTLDRTAPTLSGGESQRIRLAGQVGCGLVGVLYILDEPSIGLHPRDNTRLLETLERLRDQGNTVLVVEHDEETMRAADHVIDFGPGPGVRGGEIVAQGNVAEISKSDRSVTGSFLSGKRKIAVPESRRAGNGDWLRVIGAKHNNLKQIDVAFPLGALTCVTGVSGSGKSSLINDILVEALRRDLNNGLGEPGEHDRIEGLEHLDKMIAIDQSPIGRTPRSNPATYIKLFDEIRDLYTQLPDSKRRGYKPGRFSFNVSGGRCEACEGNGSNRLEMDFLADIWVTCPLCQGHRFNRETLQIRYKNESIADVLEMDVQQALAHFENVPSIRHKLQTLHDVGLDYLKLGQPSPTLSGGEAQRIKLARELVKKSTGKTLYLLDEPTTGLHFADIEMLLAVLHSFVEAGNTVLVVEHNTDVIKTADWITDLGPEGGAGGGQLIAAGTPEEIAKNLDSSTGQILAEMLGLSPKKSLAKPAKRKAKLKSIDAIRVDGARQHNLKGIDVVIPRDQMTVCCGPSGSGKSSLAMDTIYAEGQRRYVESLSSYARQFVGQMQKPQIEHIEGLSPAIAIEQKHMANTPRSTVGTVTEIYDYLRVLFGRAGQPYCPHCEIPIGTQTSDQIVDKILGLEADTKCYLLAPIEIQVGEKYETLWEDLRKSGYRRLRVDGQIYPVEEPPRIDRRRKHDVEVVIDRLTTRESDRSRIAESVEAALSLGRGVIRLAFPRDDQDETHWQTQSHSQHFACENCGSSFDPLTPHSFSFNSPLGWCESCEGLGVQTGANPALLLRDPKLTLAEGAVSIFPNVSQPLFRAMLAAISRATGLPTDVPYDQLATRHRRLILHGCGEQWFDVAGSGKKQASTAEPLFRFQYKGLYPALEEASRLSARLRGRLEHLVDEIECAACGGARIRDEAAAVRFRDRTIDQICRLPLETLLAEVQGWKLDERETKIAGELIREVGNRLQFLVDVGLSYLTINRAAPTLSGGEAQRIRLASQVGSGLCGVLYVLDEPTIGLHPRDNRRLIEALKKLRDLGNTLLVVEHDREVVESADQVLDFGPGAGRHGGQIVASGTPKQVAKAKGSVTGPFLSGTKAIPIPTNRRMQRATEYATSGQAVAGKSPLPPGGGWLRVVGARHNNLKNVDVRIPLGTLTVVTGVSGGGKSSLIQDVLYQQLAKTLHRARFFPGLHDEIIGLEMIDKVIQVDQQPLGNSPTSNPATYTGAFELIRELFAQIPDAKVRGYTARRFSFNVPGGRCDDCEGNGQKCIEMHFLPDVWVECETCGGKRYNPETLAVRYRGHSIADVLEMPCGDALEVFNNIPKIRRTLQTLCDVGLDYLTLGQSAPTLSGGEAQRVKLASELSRPDTGRTLYLLDEPTTGLHFEDLAKLLDVLNRLVDLGNSVVVIEHNLDVIKTADWILELGPEAGAEGGYLVCTGTPEDIVDHARVATKKSNAAKSKTAKKNGGAALMRSHTGEVIDPILAEGPYEQRLPYDFEAVAKKGQGDVEIAQVGSEAKMPWETDGLKWHTADRVGRDGSACQWNGEILSRVLEYIQQIDGFAPANFNSRTIVEVTGPRKSDGWFMHAITGDTWQIKLKFRTAKNSFDRNKLIADIGLRPLNELDDLPVYGTDQRVTCKNIRGPFQEIQLQVHSLEEIDKPEFWNMITRAAKGFFAHTERAQNSPEAVMPWKVLGKKWHLSRKGFPPGRRVHWETKVLEDLCQILEKTANNGSFQWDQQQVVHLSVDGQEQPWASVHTKRTAGIDLVLSGPKDRFAYGRVAELAEDCELMTDRPERDLVKFRFRNASEIQSKELKSFLQEHLSAVRDTD